MSGLEVTTETDVRKLVNLEVGHKNNFSSTCFTSDHQTFEIFLRSDDMSLGASIMTYFSRPLLRTTCEIIILLHEVKVVESGTFLY